MAKIKPKEIIGKIITSEVKTAFWVSWLVFVFVVGLTYIFFKYKGDFLRSVFIEAHGMLFDLFVIATFILWLNKKAEKRRNIQRWQEEIDDFREWDEKEAMFRIVGNIKRLNRNKITGIDLSYCYLENAKIGKDPQSLVDCSEAQLTISDMAKTSKGYLVITKEAKKIEWIANLQSAKLVKTHLKNSNLIEVNFKKANLYFANLQGAYLYYANFKDANLRRANLQNAFIGTANLQGTNLMEANLQGVMYITLGQLSKAKTLYKAKLDPELEKEIKEKYPHLLEKPKEKEE